MHIRVPRRLQTPRQHDASSPSRRDTPGKVAASLLLALTLACIWLLATDGVPPVIHPAINVQVFEQFPSYQKAGALLGLAPNGQAALRAIDPALLDAIVAECIPDGRSITRDGEGGSCSELFNSVKQAMLWAVRTTCPPSIWSWCGDLHVSASASGSATLPVGKRTSIRLRVVKRTSMLWLKLHSGLI